MLSKVLYLEEIAFMQEENLIIPSSLCLSSFTFSTKHIDEYVRSTQELYNTFDLPRDKAHFRNELQRQRIPSPLMVNQQLYWRMTTAAIKV